MDELDKYLDVYFDGTFVKEGGAGLPLTCVNGVVLHMLRMVCDRPTAQEFG